MKYVSPIYEIEAIETEDIMSASYVANQLGIGLSGDTTTIQNGMSIQTGTVNELGQFVPNEDASTATGVSIGINFGTLFGSK